MFLPVFRVLHRNYKIEENKTLVEWYRVFEQALPCSSPLSSHFSS